MAQTLSLTPPWHRMLRSISPILLLFALAVLWIICNFATAGAEALRTICQTLASSPIRALVFVLTEPGMRSVILLVIMGAVLLWQRLVQVAKRESLPLVPHAPRRALLDAAPVKRESLLHVPHARLDAAMGVKRALRPFLKVVAAVVAVAKPALLEVVAAKFAHLTFALRQCLQPASTPSGAPAHQVEEVLVIKAYATLHAIAAAQAVFAAPHATPLPLVQVLVIIPALIAT